MNKQTKYSCLCCKYYLIHFFCAAGQVTTARDLRTWRGTPEVYTLSIISSDGMYSDGPENLYISVTDIRQPPRITNLPSSVTVLETDTAVTNIFTVLRTLLYNLVCVCVSAVIELFIRCCKNDI